MTIRDISLGADGALYGQVVDANGAATAGKTVVVRRSDGWEAEALSDATGQFRVPELRGGVYAIAAGGPAHVCRVWSHGAAPPAAGDELLVVGGDQAVRANLACNWKNPWLWAGVIAAAVAIPIIINALDDDAS
jgi:hypothetical protein